MCRRADADKESVVCLVGEKEDTLETKELW